MNMNLMTNRSTRYYNIHINVSRISRCTRGQHSNIREASISPTLDVSCPGVHFSARFFLVALPLARLTKPPPGAASAEPASSRGGMRKVRNAGPIPYPLRSTPVYHYTVLVLLTL